MSGYGELGIQSVAGDEYLQIDLLAQAKILSIGTKGGVQYTQWVTSYKLRYSLILFWRWYNDEEILIEMKICIQKQ